MDAAMKMKLVILVCAFIPGLAAAADAGSVLFAKGDVTAERAPPVALAKGDAILDDDTISTGAASRAQLLMIDGAKIAIRPNSQLRIDEYSYAGTQAQANITTRDDKSVMSLVKGGFRTITGAIGKENKEDYEVRTAVGVLGIRGTDFAVLLCGGDCGGNTEDGLYIGVTAGAIVFRNSAGEIVVEAGEFAFVPMSSRQPEVLFVPPAVLIDDADLRFDGSTSGGPTGFDAELGTRRSAESASVLPQDEESEDSTKPGTPEQPIIGTDPDGRPVDITPGENPPPASGRTISYSTGPLGRGSTIFSGTLDNESTQLQLDVSNNLEGFTGTYPNASGTDTAAFGIGTASNVETGFDTVTVLRWGRWSGGVASGMLASDGSDVSVDLGTQSLHWVSGPDLPPPVMPITGSASYTLVGATSPTDSRGNTGVLGSASFFADFTNLTVDSTLAIDIAGSSWLATGNGDMGMEIGLPAHLFTGFYNVAITGAITGTGSGVFTGFFSEPGTTSDPSYPGGVGLTYSLQDGQGITTVSGAAVFGDP
jgi:hypothetical protein